jgi:hypothetical protein
VVLVKAFVSSISSIPSSASRQTLRPPIRWVQEAVSLRIKRPGRDTNCSPPSTREFKNVGSVPLLRHTSSQRGKKNPWPEFASELYRPSDCCLSVKLVPAFADRESVVWSARRIPFGHNPCFLDRSRYFFFQVAPQLYSRG